MRCQKLSHRETVWPPESIDPNDAMILPHGANPDRMKFSERTSTEIARAHSYLGDNIRGSGQRFELEVRVGVVRGHAAGLGDQDRKSVV